MGDMCELVFDHPILAMLSPVGILAQPTCAAATVIERDDEMATKRIDLNNYTSLFTAPTEHDIKAPYFDLKSYSEIKSEQDKHHLNGNLSYEAIKNAGYDIEVYDENIKDEFSLRTYRCAKKTCAEDCQQDEYCYWSNSGGNRLGSSAFIRKNSNECSCLPCIMAKDNITGMERTCAQKIVAKDFAENRYQDYQDDCDNTHILVKFFQSLTEDTEDNQNTYCKDLVKLFNNQYILSSSDYDSYVINDSMFCNFKNETDKAAADENRKKCKNMRIRFCENSDDKMCEVLNISYIDLFKDMFSYYVLSDTAYGSTEHCTCYPIKRGEDPGCYRIIDRDDEGNPEISSEFMDLGAADALNCQGDDMVWIDGDFRLGEPYWDGIPYLPNCYDTDDDGVLNGICSNDLPQIKLYLDTIDDGTTDPDKLQDLDKKAICKRTNSNENTQCNTYDYCTNGQYQSASTAQLESCTDNTIGGLLPQDLIDGGVPLTTPEYNREICESDIARCMGFEIQPKLERTTYTLVLDSLYYLIPTKTSNIVPEWGFLRTYYALNDYYLGKSSFNIPTGEIYKGINNLLYSYTHDDDGDSASLLIPEFGDEGHEAATTSTSDLEGGTRDQSGHLFSSDSGSLDLYRDKLMYDDQLTISYGFVRDWSILIFACILLLVILVPFSFTVLPFLIVWSLTYVTYKKYYDNLVFVRLIVPIVFGVFLYMLIKIYGKL